MGILTITIDSRKRYRIMEDSIMPAIVEFPTVVKEALDEFGDHFKNEPERKHFAEYLTGLMIANKKNVSAINREFAITTDQSCLNRWLTEVDWDEEALNQQRLDWLQQQADTRYSSQGVIATKSLTIISSPTTSAPPANIIPWSSIGSLKKSLVANEILSLSITTNSFDGSSTGS